MKRLSLILLLFSTTALAELQPCAPFYHTLKMLKGTPCGDSFISSQFHSAGANFDLDPRFLAAVAKSTTNGGMEGCGLTHKDPFRSPANCGPVYQNFISAVIDRTHQISLYYPDQLRNVNHICDQEGWNTVDVRKYISDALGQPSVLLNYSTSCCGDCNNNQQTSISEMIWIVNRTLCSINCQPLSQCPKADADFNGSMAITDVIRDRLSASYGCPAY